MQICYSFLRNHCDKKCVTTGTTCPWQRILCRLWGACLQATTPKESAARAAAPITMVATKIPTTFAPTSNANNNNKSHMRGRLQCKLIFFSSVLLRFLVNSNNNKKLKCEHLGAKCKNSVHCLTTWYLRTYNHMHWFDGTLKVPTDVWLGL